jgi:tetratricopeptide (TPR) repeat protein
LIFKQIGKPTFPSGAAARCSSFVINQIAMIFLDALLPSCFIEFQRVFVLDEYHTTILACQPFLNKLKSPAIQFKVYRHLGYYHSNQQEYETAKFYLKLSLKKALLLRDVSKQSEVYRYLGLNYMNSNQKDSALYYSDKAISTGRRSGDKAVLAQAFNVKAEVYEFFGQIELSVAKNFVSRQLAEEINNHFLLAKYCREIGYSQKQIYNLKDAEKNFRNSQIYTRLYSYCH